MNEMLKNIPTQNIELNEWDYEGKNAICGRYENESYEIEFGDYYINCYLKVCGYDFETPCTYSTPREFNRNGLTIDIQVKQVYLKDELLELTKEDYKELHKSIIRSIEF